MKIVSFLKIVVLMALLVPSFSLLQAREAGGMREAEGGRNFQERGVAGHPEERGYVRGVEQGANVNGGVNGVVPVQGNPVYYVPQPTYVQPVPQAVPVVPHS